MLSAWVTQEAENGRDDNLSSRPFLIVPSELFLKNIKVFFIFLIVEI